MTRIIPLTTLDDLPPDVMRVYQSDPERAIRLFRKREGKEPEEAFTLRNLVFIPSSEIPHDQLEEVPND